MCRVTSTTTTPRKPFKGAQSKPVEGTQQTEAGTSTAEPAKDIASLEGAASQKVGNAPNAVPDATGKAAAATDQVRQAIAGNLPTGAPNRIVEDGFATRVFALTGQKVNRRPRG